MSNNWPKVKLGEVVTSADRAEAPVPGTVYRQIGVKLWGEGAYERETMDGGQTRYTQLSRAEAGDVIVNKIWARNGSVAVVPAPLAGCYGSAEFPMFTPIPQWLEPRWMHWLTKTPYFWEQCDEKSRGTSGKNRIRPEQFLRIEIPLPTPAEQRRIVARIEELVAKTKEARDLRVEIENETNVFFAKALTKAFEPYKASMRSIGDVFSVTTGGTPSRGNPTFWGGDVKWVSSGEVNFRNIEDTEEKITRDGVEGSNAKINPPGTILLAMIGQGKTRGQCATLNCYAATNQNVAAIHVYKTPHSPEYVYWWLYSQYQQSRAVETGTAQPALSGERVKRMPIPIPSLDDQYRVVVYFNELQKQTHALKASQAEASAELDALMPSILDKAFRGEL